MKHMKHSINIGKYTLESLTSGMYASPLDLFREYVQNAADSLDLAIKKEIIKPEKNAIKITIDKNNRNICIYDNGCGITKEEVIETLLDIGNSKKRNDGSRGFRGIGRLAGLGYCDKLIFSTSYFGEMSKSIISFDARKLKSLLVPGNNDGESIEDVLNKVVTISYSVEKQNEHYFKVELINVEFDNLLDVEYVKEYLIQNLPLGFSDSFVWGKYILKRLEMEDIKIPFYNIILNNTVDNLKLKKPYEDIFVSDRIKKIKDDIKNIEFKKISIKDNELAAVMWYAISNYNGTILDDKIKGLRIRKGNILIGDKTTCNHLFKEERFNGWLIGEIHVFDERLIPNSRRDNFECNEYESELYNKLKVFADEISKNIRKISYQRSLAKEKIDIINEEENYDEDAIKDEFSNFTNSIDECSLGLDESHEVAQFDYFNKLSTLINKNNLTKYAILNINKKMTIEQKRVLERVFDLILNEWNDNNAKKLVEAIATKF